MTARSGTPSPPETDVAVVGAGPVGLTLAARLAQQGIAVTVFDQSPGHVGEGSKALCMQRETLEIWQRIGIGETVARRGVQWQVGRTYLGTRELFHVVLPGAGTEHFPPFVNISQTEVEELLLARAKELGVTLCWGHRLERLADDGGSIRLALATDGGVVERMARFLVGADGAHSTVRHLLGVDFPGHSFPDVFLICDIRAHLPFPNERRLFFDPPSNPGRQVLVHPQPDDTWRIDWQVPPETDVEAERTGGNLDRRVRGVIGDVDYELAWMTAYRFHQRLADRFRVGNAFLAGDAAHLFSPFGARGLNSGACDAENLAWKLGMVLRREAPVELLDSYEPERRAAALENLAVTDATMRFMVPHGPWQRLLRDLTLRGSTRSAWLRLRVNSGRLAEPFTYGSSPIVEVPEPGDGPVGRDEPRVGAVAPDLPLEAGGRLRDRLGTGFAVLLARPGDAGAEQLHELAWPFPTTLIDDPALAAVYGAGASAVWVVRPDGHLAARRDLRDPSAVRQLPALVGWAAGRHLPTS